MAERERSTDAIRQDIDTGKENIVHTVDQIGERIKEKLAWREHVRDSPYLAIGIAAGCGYLASRIIMPRTTPMERIMNSITGEVRSSLSGLQDGNHGAGLIKMTLIGVATKAAAGWIKNMISKPEEIDSAGTHAQTDRAATVNSN